MPSGPGVIDDRVIAEIAATVPPPIATFLLSALQNADAIAEQHAVCGTSTIQLVDSVPVPELQRLRKRLPGIKLVQVIHIAEETALEAARQVEAFVDALLLDSGNPALPVKVLGGTGRTHDWRLSRRIREQANRPVFLAGGLNAGNVAEAIRMVDPFGIDLCSGVRINGALSPTKLRRFMAATHRAGT